MLAAVDGDESCLEEVYRRHWQAMYRHALSVVGSVEAAEDVTQEAFAKTIRTIATGKEIKRVGGWLHTCVHNIALNVLKDRKRHVQVPLEEECAPSQPDAHTQAHLRQRSRSVLEALSSLTKHQRSAFVLAEVQGLDYKQIAAELGTSVGSVRVLLFRARQQIRDTLGPETASLAGPLLREQMVFPVRRLATSPAAGWSMHVKEQLVAKVGDISNWISSIPARFDYSIAGSGVALIVGAAVVAGPVGVLGVVGDRPGTASGPQATLEAGGGSGGDTSGGDVPKDESVADDRAGSTDQVSRERQVSSDLSRPKTSVDEVAGTGPLDQRDTVAELSTGTSDMAGSSAGEVVDQVEEEGTGGPAWFRPNGFPYGQVVCVICDDSLIGMFGLQDGIILFGTQTGGSSEPALYHSSVAGSPPVDYALTGSSTSPLSIYDVFSLGSSGDEGDSSSGSSSAADQLNLGQLLSAVLDRIEGLLASKAMDQSGQIVGGPGIVVAGGETAAGRSSSSGVALARLVDAGNSRSTGSGLAGEREQRSGRHQGSTGTSKGPVGPVSSGGGGSTTQTPIAGSPALRGGDSGSTGDSQPTGESHSSGDSVPANEAPVSAAPGSTDPVSQVPISTIDPPAASVPQSPRPSAGGSRPDANSGSRVGGRGSGTGQGRISLAPVGGR